MSVLHTCSTKTHVYRWKQHNLVPRTIEINLNARPIYVLQLLLFYCNSKRGIGFRSVPITIAVRVCDSPLSNK